MFTIEQTANSSSGSTTRRMGWRASAWEGTLGDAKPVGEVVSEMRDLFGSDW